MRKFISIVLILALSLCLVPGLQANSDTEVMGKAKVTAYKYRADGSADYNVNVHIKIVSKRNDNFFDSYVLYPSAYASGYFEYIWFVDNDEPILDVFFYFTNSDTKDVTFYVTYFNSDGGQIYTQAFTSRPDQTVKYSARAAVCRSRNPIKQALDC